MDFLERMDLCNHIALRKGAWGGGGRVFGSKSKNNTRPGKRLQFANWKITTFNR